MSTALTTGYQSTLARIDVTGATQFTVPFPQARAGKLVFHGTLGQSIDVFLPVAREASPGLGDEGRDWTISNETSGGFSITLRGPEGDGIAVSAGVIVTLYWDGTDMRGAGASGAGLPASVGGVSTLYPLTLTDPQIGDAITFNGDSFVNQPAGGGSAIGDPVTGGTPGSVLFIDASGDLGEDNTQLFWDDTGNRLGVGLNTHTAKLQVRDNSNPEVFIAEGAGVLSSVFFKLGVGNLAAAVRVYPGTAATSGTTIVESGGIILRGHYWNGAASTPLDGTLRLRVDATTPRYYLALETEGESRLLVRGSDGQVWLGGDLSAPSTGLTEAVILNGSARFVSTSHYANDLTLADNVRVFLPTGVGTQWGTDPAQKQAWWGATGVVRGTVTGASHEDRLNSLLTLLESYGLIEATIPAANMLWDFNADRLLGTPDNTAVAIWPDDGPHGVNMVSPGTNGGTQFKFRNNGTDNINGHPVIETIAGDQAEIPTPNFSPSLIDDSFTHYYVGRYTAAQADHGMLIYTFVTPGDRAVIRLYLSGDLVGANQVGWEHEVSLGAAVDVDIAAAVDGVQLLTFVFDKSAGNGKVYRNGSQIGSTSTDVGGTGAGNGFDWGNDFIEFFAANGGTNTLVGEHARLIGYNVAHDDTTRQAIEAELMAYYGI